MDSIATAAVLVALLLLFTKLKKALAKDYHRVPRITALGLFVLSFVGVWLGFIVLDGATYLLLVLILLFGYDLPHANALKVFLPGARSQEQGQRSFPSVTSSLSL